jgi:hypothetical protein
MPRENKGSRRSGDAILRDHTQKVTKVFEGAISNLAKSDL